MAYPPITPALFKATKPQFVEVDDAAVQLYLDMGGLAADASWPEPEWRMGVIAMTCHLMTLDGLGTDAASRSFAKGMGDIQSIKSADLSLTRFAKAATSSYQQWLQSTPCGQQYAFRLRMTRGGPRVAMAASSPATSGYAKDAHSYGWPGVFGV